MHKWDIKLSLIDRHAVCFFGRLIVDGTKNKNSSTDAAESWKEVVAQFRSLCFARRQGDAAVSGKILQEQLPTKIAEWSRTTPEKPESKRVQLEQMFREEQRRVEDAWTLHELSSMQLRQDLIPALTSKLSSEVKSVILQQLAEQATQQNQLAADIKQALVEQFQAQAAREAAQQALLESVKKTMQEAAARAAGVQKEIPTPAPPQKSSDRPDSGTIAATAARIPFDDIPAIIDQINEQEKRDPKSRQAVTRPIHDLN